MWYKSRHIKQLLWFTGQLNILLNAGMGFTASLKILIKSCDDKKMTAKIQSISRDIECGRSFSEALARQPDYFDLFYIEMIRIGECTGKLTEILSELQKYWTLKQNLQQDLAKALLYPLVVMCLMLVLTAGLCFTVIPKFAVIFASFNTPLPWATRALFQIVSYMSSHILIIIFIFGLIFWLGRYFLTQKTQPWLESVRLFKLPFFGKLYQSQLLFRLFKTLGIALKAGLSMQDSLSLLKKMFKNTPYKKGLLLLEHDLKQGYPLSQIFNRKSYFPEVYQAFILIAEETGTLDLQLLNLADLIEKQITLILERFKILLEPTLMLATGLIVGAVVMAIYYPVFSLSGAI